MTEATAPRYELTLDVGAGFDGDIDEHLRPMADAEPGIGVTDVDIYRAGTGEDRHVRIIALSFANEPSLQRFMEQHAGAFEDQIQQSFGDNAQIKTRTLVGESPQLLVNRCLNCDAVLVGQYCGQCGQRAQNRLISIWELVRDAFGDLFELDSRIWRTLVPLAIRPGLLTSEYLRGRRARFMPPFRMYLVLSLAFFLIAFFDPYRELGILFEDPEPPAPAAETQPGTSTDAAREDAADDDDDGRNLRVQFGNESQDISDCDMSEYDTSEMPDWLARRLTRERVRAVCEDVFLEGGNGWQPVVDRFVENIPAGLFVLLPLMAFILKVLYPLSRRYYVEHLLFVIHYHSFVFLILTVEVLFSRMLGLLRLPEALAEFSGLVAFIYIPVYLYKAQRRVYDQGHLLTLPKFLVLVCTYIAGLSFIALVAGVVAAFSV